VGGRRKKGLFVLIRWHWKRVVDCDRTSDISILLFLLLFLYMF
jgi:hypothetical protein